MPDEGLDEAVVLCDTSFVSVMFAASRNKKAAEVVDNWPSEKKYRLEGVVHAVSVFTLAEQRAGFKNAKWGEQRVRKASNHLAAYLLIGFDMDVIEKWAEIDAALR